MLHIKWKIAKYFITCDKNFYVKVVYRKKHIKHQTVFIYVCVFIISYLLPTFPCKNMQYSTLSTMNIGPKIENLISPLAAACFQWVRASLNSKSHHNSTLAPSAHDASYWKSELILNYSVMGKIANSIGLFSDIQFTPFKTINFINLRERDSN